MNSETFDYLVENAIFLSTLDAGSPPPGLRKSLSSALRILSYVPPAPSSVSISELHALSGSPHEAIRQTLRALILGGYPLKSKNKGSALLFSVCKS